METYLLCFNSWLVGGIGISSLGPSKKARKHSKGQYDSPFLAEDYRRCFISSGFR